MLLAAIAQSWDKFTIKLCRLGGSSAVYVFCPGSNSIVLDCDRIRAASKSSKASSDRSALEKDRTPHVGAVELKRERYRVEHTPAQDDRGTPHKLGCEHGQSLPASHE